MFCLKLFITLPFSDSENDYESAVETSLAFSPQKDSCGKVSGLENDRTDGKSEDSILLDKVTHVANTDNINFVPKVSKADEIPISVNTSDACPQGNQTPTVLDSLNIDETQQNGFTIPQDALTKTKDHFNNHPYTKLQINADSSIEVKHTPKQLIIADSIIPTKEVDMPLLNDIIDTNSHMIITYNHVTSFRLNH